MTQSLTPLTNKIAVPVAPLQAALSTNKLTAASMLAQLAAQPTGAALRAGPSYAIVTTSSLDVSGEDDSGNSLTVGTLITGGRSGATVLYLESPVYTVVGADGNSYSIIPMSSIVGVVE